MKGKKLLIGLLAAVALVAVTVAPVMADTGTTEITGTVPKAIEVTAPVNFEMPSLDPGTSPESAAKTATVKANHAGWQLTVKDAMAAIDAVSKDASIEGYMWTGATTTTLVLASPLDVKGGDLMSYADLTSERTLESSGASGTTDVDDIYFQQAVGWGDEAGDYSITVTFTATPAS